MRALVILAGLALGGAIALVVEGGVGLADLRGLGTQPESAR